jgi:hypothetical protein
MPPMFVASIDVDAHPLSIDSYPVESIDNFSSGSGPQINLPDYLNRQYDALTSPDTQANLHSNLWSNDASLMTPQFVRFALASLPNTTEQTMMTMSPPGNQQQHQTIVVPGHQPPPGVHPRYIPSMDGPTHFPSMNCWIDGTTNAVK